MAIYTSNIFISKKQGTSCLPVPFKVLRIVCIANKGEKVLKVKQFCPISILFLLKQIDYEFLMRLEVCEPLCVWECKRNPFDLLFFSTDHKQDIRHPSHPVRIGGFEREAELWRDHTLSGHHSGQRKSAQEEEKYSSKDWKITRLMSFQSCMNFTNWDVKECPSFFCL